MSQTSPIVSTPVESFARVIYILETISKMIGTNVSKPGYRMGRITYVTITAITIYYIFTFSTILLMYKKNGGQFALEACCMLGSVIQGTVKLSTGIANALGICAMRTRMEAIYSDYAKKGEQYCLVLNRNCDSVRRILQLIGLAYVASLFGLLLHPLPSFIRHGKRNLMMHFYIPGFDVNTDYGYFVTLVAHSLCLFIGGFGLFAGDLHVLIFFMQSFTFVDIFKLKIEELNRATEEEYSEEKDKQITRMLIDIAKWHQIYSEYTISCNNNFYWMISAQVATSGLPIILTIFVLLTSDWSGALPYLIVVVCNLYIYCVMGTKIEICNDDFCSEMYNISWYNLTVPQQRIVCFMLAKSQSPNAVQVMNVMPLSVSTALQITKTIYSATMMMVQFVLE